MSERREVTVTYLTMDTPAAHRRSRPLDPGVLVQHVAMRDAAPVAAAMYGAVGAAWHWIDRRDWSAAQWSEAIARPDVELWVASMDDAPLGYFQLQAGGGSVELQYFGLLPAAIGRGIGGPLLSIAIDRAWAKGAPRISVNTCTLDHPAALANYLARGFTVVRTETGWRMLPA